MAIRASRLAGLSIPHRELLHPARFLNLSAFCSILGWFWIILPGSSSGTSKDNFWLPLASPGQQRIDNGIPCECSQIYSEQTSCSTDTRSLDHVDKWAMVGHLGHGIQLQNTSILSTKFRYKDHIIREVTQTELDSTWTRRTASA